MEQDNFVTMLADSASNVVKKAESKAAIKNNGCLPVIFMAVFIGLLVYMGFNFAKMQTPAKNDAISVGGVFYGNVKPDANGKINIPLGSTDNLKKSNINVSNENNDKPSGNPTQEPKPEPDEPQTDVQIKITDRLKVGMSMFDVIALLGAPSSKLDVNKGKIDTGFKVYVWDQDKRLMVTFYKNKLHSVSLNVRKQDENK
jgi:hypothetical protein